MKKTIVLLVVLMMALLSLYGCSKNAEGASAGSIPLKEDEELYSVDDKYYLIKNKSYEADVVNGEHYIYFDQEAFAVATTSKDEFKSKLNDELAAKFMESVKSSYNSNAWSDYTVISEPEKISINGIDAWKTSFSMKHDKEFAYKGAVVIFVANKSLATIAFTSPEDMYEQYIAAYDELVDSIEIIK